MSARFMSSEKRTALFAKILSGLSWKRILFIIIGAMICSFGIHNIHQQTGITEGGVIGLMLFIEH